jgi:hypothetical protein
LNRYNKFGKKLYLLSLAIPIKMKHAILEERYEEKFVDTNIYSPNTVFFLRGLAAAIQDAHPTWRPNVSELVKMLTPCDEKYRNSLLNAGASYGAAKQVGSMYPGPAILLFGAALQAIGEGSCPNEELKEHIASAENKFELAGLSKDTDIKSVLAAAKERTRLDSVSKLMKTEFRKGLESAGCSENDGYSSERLERIVHKIVDITHDVRHRAVIDKTYVHIIEPNKMCMIRQPSGSSVGVGIYIGEAPPKSEDLAAIRSASVRDSSESISDPFADIRHNIPEGGTYTMTSDFQDLLSYAQKGCANRILNFINKIREQA